MQQTVLIMKDTCAFAHNTWKQWLKRAFYPPIPLILQEPVIELDSNAAIQWDLTQPGESQWDQ